MNTITRCRTTLSSIADGAVEEKYGAAELEIARNIADERTSYKEKRQIIITLTYYPMATRDAANVEIDVKTKLAPMPAVARIGIENRGGIAVMVEESGQFAMAFEEQVAAEIESLESRRRKREEGSDGS